MKPLVAVPATALLIYRAWSRRSLTPAGILTAAGTAVAHAVHPWSAFYAFLSVFFLAGTAVTKVKHARKSTLTVSSTSSPSSVPTPRTAAQVLSNSLTASLLILLHAYHLSAAPRRACLLTPAAAASALDLIPYAVLAHYAAVTSDTFSSELGILSAASPRLVTAPWRVVPRGTNGGVTLAGLGAGGAGAALIGAVAALSLPLCDGGWSVAERLGLVGFAVAAGAAGTLLDSLMGALLQASVVDVRSGRVVEGDGGQKVLFASERGGGVQTGRKVGRKVLVGRDWLSNNGVNFWMATSIALGAWAGLWAWNGMSLK